MLNVHPFDMPKGLKLFKKEIIIRHVDTSYNRIKSKMNWLIWLACSCQSRWHACWI